MPDGDSTDKWEDVIPDSDLDIRTNPRDPVSFSVVDNYGSHSEPRPRRPSPIEEDIDEVDPDVIFNSILAVWDRWNPDVIKVQKEQLTKFYENLRHTLQSDTTFPSYAHLGLDDASILENHCRDLNHLANKYEPHDNGVFEKIGTGIAYQATPSKISYLGPKDAFGPEQARDMVHDFARRNKAMTSEETKIKLENCNRRQKIFLLNAIDEYNQNAPEHKQIKTDQTYPRLKTAKHEAEWDRFSSDNPIIYYTGSFFDAEPGYEGEDTKAATDPDAKPNVKDNDSSEAESWEFNSDKKAHVKKPFIQASENFWGGDGNITSATFTPMDNKEDSAPLKKHYQHLLKDFQHHLNV